MCCNGGSLAVRLGRHNEFPPSEMSQVLPSRKYSPAGDGCCCIFLASVAQFDPIGEGDTRQAGRDQPISEGVTGKKRGTAKVLVKILLKQS